METWCKSLTFESSIATIGAHRQSGGPTSIVRRGESMFRVRLPLDRSFQKSTWVKASLFLFAACFHSSTSSLTQTRILYWKKRVREVKLYTWSPWWPFNFLTRFARNGLRFKLLQALAAVGASVSILVFSSLLQTEFNLSHLLSRGNGNNRAKIWHTSGDMSSRSSARAHSQHYHQLWI